MSKSMSSQRDRVEWQLHSWKEIDGLDRDESLLIIPTGAIEQHGPHLPVDTDIFNANAIALAIAKESRSPRTLVLPPIWWGTSPHHLGFPGTLSLRNETFFQIIRDVVSSLKPHGFYRFLIINGHGGNAGIITATVSQLSEDLGISIPAYSYWQSIRDTLVKVGESSIGGMGHACEMETSLALHLRPESVDLKALRSDIPDEKTPWSCIDFRQGGFLGIPLDLKRDSREGVIGDPMPATAAKGKTIFDAAVEVGSKVVSDLAKLSKAELITSRY
ncbi:MAG: creatininase family protein [Actinobacteria bacterium]|nr:creatininase family protein [Actinomycetota bacterium]